MRNEWRCWLRLGAAALAIGMASLSPAADEQPGSPPNRFSGTSVMQVNAVVLALDPGRNSMTLLQDNGDAFDVVVDPGIGDVDRLQLGDTITVTLSRALLLRADKVDSGGIRKRVDKEFATGSPLDSSLSLHRIEAVVTIVHVDRDKRQITLRGPTRTVVLQASSASLLDGLTAGESVSVDYVEAAAVKITRRGVPLH